MPKIKTHKGAAKRFHLTGSGKVRRSKAFAGHLMTAKTRKRKRNLRQLSVLAPADEKKIKALLYK